MTEKQAKAYYWLKEHDYYHSKGVRCGLELVELIDMLIEIGIVEPPSKEVADG